MIRQSIRDLEDSPILDIFREGFRVPGIIPMWAGEPDVPTPRFICDAASQALAEGRTFYSDNRGLPALRTALAGYHRRLYDVDLSDNRIAFTFSGMNAVMQVTQATLTAGDSAIAITPSWPNALRAMQINGAQVHQVALTHDRDGWHLSLDDVFAAVDQNTRLIYLATPGNPTGWMIQRRQAEELLAFCRNRGIALLSDEVYHRIVYDRPVAFSFLEIAQPSDPLFVVNSFSKSWAMTGWRMGWLIYPEGCTSTFEKLIQFNTSGGLEFMQAAGVAAIEGGEDFVSTYVGRCRAGHHLVAERLWAMPNVQPIPAQGAFYATFEVNGVVDTMQFCRRAIHEAKIGMAPGISFGRGAERLIRICYAKSTELLEEAMTRLSTFVSTYVETPLKTAVLDRRR